MNQISKSNITKHHIELVSKYKLSKASANKLIKYLSYAYNMAIEWELPYITINPLKNIKQYQLNNNREIYLDSIDIKRLLNAADNYPNNININIKYIIRFLLLTGARRNEVLNAKWQDINLNLKVFTIPLSKSGQSRTIPISKALEELILNIPKTSKTYIFSALTKDKPINTIFRHWDNVRKRANLPKYVKKDGKMKILYKRLETFFEEDKDINRNTNIKKAFEYGYTKTEIAIFLNLSTNTINTILK